MTHRLSKLQKWILISTYNKTVLKANTGLTIPKYFQYAFKKGDTDFYYTYLFRSEILLDYFHLPVDFNKFAFQRIQHFKGNNNKAHVSLTRSLALLQDTDLITIFNGANMRWQGIQLTDKGRGIVLKLTNDN